MSIKAVHLELFSVLTIDGFLANLKRLFSRRGESIAIYSDNKTSFVGISWEFIEFDKLFESKANKDVVKKYFDHEKIAWHLIPSKSPHFVDIWEAAVKSFKHHLLCTDGNILLTYEQLEKFIIDMEKKFNSRPIFPMSFLIQMTFLSKKTTLHHYNGSLVVL